MRGGVDERGRKLFIGGLHLKTNEDSLKAFYSQWGELIDVVVMRDPQNGKSRGFGFVTYSDPASVDIAQGNRPHEIDGIKVDAKRAMPKEDTSPEFHATVNRLFVGRLKKHLTAEDLKQYFSDFGSIADAVIINNPNGESRGFGFVTFDDPDSVDKIIVSRPHELDGQVLEVKKALPRDSGGKGDRGAAPPKSSSRGGYANSAPRTSNFGNSGGRGASNYSSGSGNYNAPSNPRYQEEPIPTRPAYSGGAYGSNDGYRSDYAAPYSQPPQQQAPQTGYTGPARPYQGGGGQYDHGYYGGGGSLMERQQPPPQAYQPQQMAAAPPYGDGEPEYGYGDYGQPQGRPYGYPPMATSQRPPGGPIRGGRGAPPRYGTSQPY